MSQLLSMTKLAAELAVSKGTVCRWMQAGIITPHIREGYIIRFILEDVKAELAERKKSRAKA